MVKQSVNIRNILFKTEFLGTMVSFVQKKFLNLGVVFIYLFYSLLCSITFCLLTFMQTYILKSYPETGFDRSLYLFGTS